MSILFEPSKLVKRIAPVKKIRRLLKYNFSLKRTALSFVDELDFLNKAGVMRIALKTIKGYKERIKEDPDIKQEILDDPKQLVQRVQNEVLFQVHNEIKDTYEGEFYIWLPSDAEEPRPEHQLNYGKKFQIGDGEMPGDEFGCKCGMEILTKDSSLNLE